jgi:hypothetical protein
LSTSHDSSSQPRIAFETAQANPEVALCDDLRGRGCRLGLAADVKGIALNSVETTEPQQAKPAKRRKGLTPTQRNKISDGLKSRWRDPLYRSMIRKAIREGVEKKKGISPAK